MNPELTKKKVILSNIEEQQFKYQNGSNGWIIAKALPQRLCVCCKPGSNSRML